MKLPDPAASRTLPLLVGTALVLGFLYWAKVVVIPVALAVLFTFLLSPLVDWLETRRLPRVPAVVLVTLLTMVLIASALFGITRQVSSLLDAYPRYESNITAKIDEFRRRGHEGLLDKLQAVSERISYQLDHNRAPPATADERDVARAQPVRIVSEGPFRFSQMWSVAGPLLEPLATLGLVLVLVVFMLVHREDLRDRIISLIGVRQLADTTRALKDASDRVSRYLLMQLLVNLGFGTAVALGLWLIGVPYALLWGSFAAFLRYIPYLGSWLAAILPVAMSMLVARDWSMALMCVGLFAVLELITNMIVEPLLYGRGMGVSQAALLIAVAFWTWLWGPVGLILASPMTVCLVVLGKHVPFLKFLDTLLGDHPPLSPAHRFYQRMLALDEDEASELIDDIAACDGLGHAYDAVMVPMMAQARIDLRQGRLEALVHDRLIEDVRDVVAAHKREIRPDAMVGHEQMKVLAIPSRDELDEVLVAMLGKLVDMGRIDWEATSSAALASDVIEQVRRAGVDTVVLASVPPGGLAHIRYLCKRLRLEFAGLRIVAVRPGLYPSDVISQRNNLLAAGADRMVTSLAAAVTELNSLAALD